jgi:hypothetical protein
MKITSIVLIAFMAGILFVNCSDSANKEKVSSEIKTGETKASAIDGAWETVSFQQNNQPGTNNQFKIFNGGFFSLISRDSAGKFSYAGYGKYELDGNLYKETFLYHYNAAYIGAINWQEFELKEDTLYMKGFNKVVLADGVDKTADFPKFVEKRVRAK